MAKKKSEFDTLNDKLDRVIDAMATRDDIRRVEDRVEKIEGRLDIFDEKFEKIIRALDALSKVVTDLRLEYMVINTQLNRHDEWIRLLAKKMGLKLPE